MQEEETLPFWHHVGALRKALINISLVIALGFGVALICYKEIFDFLLSTLNPIAKDNLVLLTPIEGLLITFKTCFWVSLVATSPFWIYYLLNFILPALRENESRLVLPFLFSSAFFLFSGFSFAFFIIIPFASQYLMEFNGSLGSNLWSVSSYVNFSLILLLANGLAFELFVILLFLVHFGIFKAKNMADKRRHMVVACFILAALLTPPDVPTQIMLAVPMVGLYELSILYARYREWKQKPKKTESVNDYLTGM